MGGIGCQKKGSAADPVPRASSDDWETGTRDVLCDIPVDEYVSWICGEQYALWYTTIRAANPQYLWGMMFRDVVEEVGRGSDNTFSPLLVGCLELRNNGVLGGDGRLRLVVFVMNGGAGVTASTSILGRREAEPVE